MNLPSAMVVKAIAGGGNRLAGEMLRVTHAAALTLGRGLGRRCLVQLGPQHLDIALRLRELLPEIEDLGLEALRLSLPALLPTSLPFGIGQGHVGQK